MCNNIRSNFLRKPEKEVVKDKITDWIEDRPKLPANEIAKKSRKSGSSIKITRRNKNPQYQI